MDVGNVAGDRTVKIISEIPLYVETELLRLSAKYRSMLLEKYWSRLHVVRDFLVNTSGISVTRAVTLLLD